MLTLTILKLPSILSLLTPLTLSDTVGLYKAMIVLDNKRHMRTVDWVECHCLVTCTDVRRVCNSKLSDNIARMRLV